ncbi:hypothetical protein QLR68_39785, partial [Micromonospora sp. DH15]|nr:hypothetical protein [Micromonospora sp. DH15]
ISLIHFLSEFTNDTSQVVAIIGEIEYLTKFQEDMVNQYYTLLQQKKVNELTEKNKLIKNELRKTNDDCAKSESIAHMGHWKLDYESGRIQCSKEIYTLLGIENHEDLSLDKLKSFITNDNNYIHFLENLPH